MAKHVVSEGSCPDQPELITRDYPAVVGRCGRPAFARGHASPPAYLCTCPLYDGTTDGSAAPRSRMSQVRYVKPEPSPKTRSARCRDLRYQISIPDTARGRGPSQSQGTGSHRQLQPSHELLPSVSTRCAASTLVRSLGRRRLLPIPTATRTRTQSISPRPRRLRIRPPYLMSATHPTRPPHYTHLLLLPTPYDRHSPIHPPSA